MESTIDSVATQRTEYLSLDMSILHVVPYDNSVVLDIISTDLVCNYQMSGYLDHFVEYGREITEKRCCTWCMDSYILDQDFELALLIDVPNNVTRRFNGQ